MSTQATSNLLPRSAPPVWARIATLSAAVALVLAVVVLQRPAQSAADPGSFLENYGDRAIALLSDGSKSEAQRYGDFRALLSEGFDLESISAFVLTPYWRQATEAQRKRFIEAFQGVLATRFLPLFEDAKSESFAIQSTRNVRGREDLYSVESVLIGDDGRRVRTDWRIKETGGVYRVLDVSVEGASMAQTFRDEYRAFVRRSDQGIESLIQLLEKRTQG